MTPRKQSDIFKSIIKLWKFFGIWFDRNPSLKHRYYSYVILINLVVFNILLNVNLCFAPRKIKYVIPELIFYFTEIAITSKVFMVIIMRDKILEAFNIMDEKDLGGNDEASKKIIERDNANFSAFWKFFIVLSQVAFTSLIFVPIILHFTIEAEIQLPISQYYFFSDEFRDKYFFYLFAYQSFSIYIHMMYNISVDTFVAGLILTGVTKLRVLKKELMSLKLSDEEKMLTLKDQDEVQNKKLQNILLRYGLVLKYCSIMQEIISVNMFVIFGLSSAIICVTLCELLFLETAIGLFVCMIMYLFAMSLQIFLPTYLGTLINHESTELIFAAYCTEWIPRSETFKKNLRIFIERTKSPIQITGLKIFTMSLSTFTSMVKTAYSFFTLIRNFQD